MGARAMEGRENATGRREKECMLWKYKRKPQREREREREKEL